MKSRLVVLLVAASLAAAACSKDDGIPKGENPQTRGNTTYVEKGLIDSFPRKDVPLVDADYKQSSEIRSGDEVETWTVSLTKKGKFNQISGDVREELIAAGYEVTDEQSTSSNQIVVLKNDDYQIALTLQDDGNGGVVIIYNVTRLKKPK